MIKVAVPNKGSLSEAATSILAEAGYKGRGMNKVLNIVDDVNDVEFFFLRPKDIAIYVASGVLDLGITGRDLAADSRADVQEILDLGFGSSTFRYASVAGEDWSVDKLEGKRIATSYPNIVRQDLKDRGLNAEVIRSADELEYVDLDRDWWISAMRDCYSIGGRQFFLTGPIVVNNYLDSTCVLFNKNVTAMFGISDDELYGTVRDGKWTIDKMFEVAAVVPENTAGVAGNGIWRYQQPDGIAFIMASGMKLTQFDEEGYPYVESSLPREISDLADKICPVFSDNSQTIFVYIAKGERDEEKYGTDHLEQFFIDDRVLFRFNVTHDVISMRTNDVRFGVLPLPKYNDNQKNYSTWAAIGWDSAVYIPKTVDSIRFTDAILEAMGALGEKYIKNAYYDKLLRSQSIFDLDSRDMLDIIFSTKVYDMAGLYDNGGMNGYGDFLNAINNGVVYDNGNLASGYRGNARFANYMAKNLRKTVDKTE